MRGIKELQFAKRFAKRTCSEFQFLVVLVLAVTLAMAQLLRVSVNVSGWGGVYLSPVVLGGEQGVVDHRHGLYRFHVYKQVGNV